MKIIFLLFLITSCNESPLLNHKNPGKTQAILSPVQSWLDVDWMHAPLVNENSPFEIQLKNELLENEVLEVELFMPSMGHGSSPVVIQKINSLLYQVDEVYFIMPGDWEVRIHKKRDGKIQNDFVIRLNF